MSKAKSRFGSALFIMPRSSKAWSGSAALWITVAGWASAYERKFGKTWIITTDKIAQPDEVLQYPSSSSVSSLPKGNSLKWIPQFLKIVIKDIRLYLQTRNWIILERQPWAHDKVAFVWQQHDLFSGPGRKLATKLNVPLVTYVHAPAVWEAAKWGVKRYIWGWFLERFVETHALKQSDLVACVSVEVAEKLTQMGVDQNKILVSPMAVDPFLFKMADANATLKKELSLENSFVIGWTGSFRSFHGLDLLVKAFQKVHKEEPNSKLFLVGDGAERKSMESLVEELNLSHAVIFAGSQPFARIPSYVSVFDIAVVSARSVDGFHYSPLKLREYLAAGKPVLAPIAGEIPSIFVNREHLLLYDINEPNSMSEGLQELIRDEALRNELSSKGNEHVLRSGTWDVELSKIIVKLNLA